MKKFVFVGLCLCMCLVPNIPMTTQPVYASSAEIEVTRADVDTFLSGSGVKRVAFSAGERKSANYLADKMRSAGLEYYQGDSFVISFGSGDEVSQNVVGVKRSAVSDRLVILGAHYDSHEGSKGGVFDNASGVVVVLRLMEALRDVELPYSVVYVFYGAEEAGMRGSKHFVQNMSALTEKRILVAMNFDSIGVGEHNYYYCGDTLNAHASLFEGNGYGVESYPTYRRPNYLAGSFGIGYTHVGMQSDNFSYIQNSIRSVTFFSGNASEVALGYKESMYFDDVRHTNGDDLNNILSMYPHFLDNMSAVTNMVYDSMVSEGFYTTLYDIRETNLNFFSDKIIVICVGLVGLLFVNKFLTKRILM